MPSWRGDHGEKVPFGEKEERRKTARLREHKVVPGSWQKPDKISQRESRTGENRAEDMEKAHGYYQSPMTPKRGKGRMGSAAGDVLGAIFKG